MTNASPNVRYHACFILGQHQPLHSDSATRALAAAIDDSDFTVRCRAAIALGQVRSSKETAIQALIKGLRDSTSPVRYAAARSLRQFGVDAIAAIPALTATKEREAALSDGVSRPGHLGNKSPADVISAIEDVLAAIDVQNAAVRDSTE